MKPNVILGRVAYIHARTVCSVVVVAFLLGCSPPGPKALLDGEKLVRSGAHSEAVERFLVATELLPENAHAWNYLGLAYHALGKTSEASQAYRQAINKDRNLAIARFNLGCLLLESGQTSAAVDALTSFTVMQPQSEPGLVKLAAAQLKAKQIDAAENSLKKAIQLNPKNPESLSNLGWILSQKRRTREAYNQFLAAIQVDPKYPPALLNLAVVSHQLNHRTLAIKAYRDFLQTKRDAHMPTADQILPLLAGLEAELAPPKPVPTTLIAPGTNLVSDASALQKRSGVQPIPTNLVNSMGSSPKGASNRLASSIEVTSSRSNANPSIVAKSARNEEKPAPTLPGTVLPGQNSSTETAHSNTSAGNKKPVQPPVVPVTSPIRATNLVVVAKLPPVPKESVVSSSSTAKPQPKTEPAPPQPAITNSTPAPQALAKTQESPESKPVAASVNPTVAVTAPSPSLDSEKPFQDYSITLSSSRQPRVSTTEDPNAERPGFWRKINPGKWLGLGGKDETGNEAKPLQVTPLSPRELALNPASATPKVQITTTVTQVPLPEPVPQNRFPRYSSKVISNPTKGDREKAKAEVAVGLRAHQESRFADAVAAYRKAVAADPSFYDAQYHLGVASMDTGDLPSALLAYETAVALQPELVPSRYNFALALRKAGHPLDAADQAKALLQHQPREVRAHLLLGNLASQELGPSNVAREHYMKVLELDPRHPQASIIRNWLAVHP